MSSQDRSEAIIPLMFANAREDMGLLNKDLNTRRKLKGEALRNCIFEAVSAEMHTEHGLAINLVAETLYDHAVIGATLPIDAPSFEAGLHRVVYDAPFAAFFERVPELDRQVLHEFFSNDARTAEAITSSDDDPPDHGGVWREGGL